jgi:aspartyl/glutamyl-tRNA(Asn/Gln) amidotransferase C subunit
MASTSSSQPAKTITQADVEHLAALARIALSPEEAATLRHDIEGILGYVARINTAVEVGDTAPQAGEVRNVVRTDAVTVPAGVYTEPLLAEAGRDYPDRREGNTVAVRKVIEQD